MTAWHSGFRCDLTPAPGILGGAASLPRQNGSAGSTLPWDVPMSCQYTFMDAGDRQENSHHSKRRCFQDGLRGAEPQPPSTWSVRPRWPPYHKGSHTVTASLRLEPPLSSPYGKRWSACALPRGWAKTSLPCLHFCCPGLE